MSSVRTSSSFWTRNLRAIFCVILGVLAIHDIFGAHGILAMQRTQKQMEQLRGDIARLNKENAALADHVKSLKTDPKVIERIAREMGMARPGELIFKLPEPAKKPAATPDLHQ